MTERSVSLSGYWGVLGFIAILGSAIYRLAPVALQPLQAGLSVGQWLLLVGWVIFMLYSEAYKGFHLQASPRIVARALQLPALDNKVLVAFAPLYCMGLFYASRKRLIISWMLVFAIVSLVVAVRMLEQPWRGIIDAGVVVGLISGSLSTLMFLARAVAGYPPTINPDLPVSIAHTA